jgi:3-oxoacyl-[acyl-carrier-protein] synthase-3
MLSRAGRDNPIDLLGARFIIEGLGNRIASTWAEMIQNQLTLPNEAVSFFTYHGENDEGHFDRLEEALNSDLLTEEAVDAIVKTAKVTGRLYRLQLEELSNY